ncbi:MAG: hypothetical protein AAFV43_03935 [Planctomycetota bacterium]
MRRFPLIVAAGLALLYGGVVGKSQAHRLDTLRQGSGNCQPRAIGGVIVVAATAA